MSANSKVRHTLNLSAARVGQIRDLFEVPPTRPVEVGIYVILVDSPWPLCPWGGKVLDGISTPLSSNMTLQSVEQTDKETRSLLVSLSLGPLLVARKRYFLALGHVDGNSATISVSGWKMAGKAQHVIQKGSPLGRSR